MQNYEFLTVEILNQRRIEKGERKSPAGFGHYDVPAELYC
jgi:hypothetical protein